MEAEWSVTTYGDEAETGRTRKALGDAPEVGDSFYHIFDSVLQFSVIGIRAISIDRALERQKFLFDFWHKSEEVLRERR